MRRSTITYQEKLNELRMDLPNPNNRGKTLVLVEGDSDIRLFRKLFDADHCKVENIPGGKFKLEDCVEELIRSYPLVIGIRDADFEHLKSSSYSKSNMFLTDYHDIEVTMLAQKEILHAFLFEYTGMEKSGHLDFREKVLQSIKSVGSEFLTRRI